MKKIFLGIAFSALLIAGCTKEYDDTSIKGRVDKIEEQIDTDSETMKRLEDSMKDAVTNGLSAVVSPVNGGNRITFSDGQSFKVMDGKDGTTGVQGQTGPAGAAGKDAAVSIAESADGSELIITINNKDYRIKKGKFFVFTLADIEPELAPGESVEISYTLMNADETVKVYVSGTSGYAASVDQATKAVTITAPQEIPESGFVVFTAIKNSTGEVSSQYIGFGKKVAPEQKIPIVRINVENGAGITSKDDYVKISISIQEGENITLNTTGRAKGRGNATWINYPKKPYKIKFDSKQGIFGFPANKDWVFLAEYCDRSLLRTVYMQELAKALNMPYPFHYKHIHLYLNDEYRGIYLVTEQVEKKSDRVDISDDGFLFENDGRYSWEPLWFCTQHKGYYYTFKYPDPEDGEIAQGDENFNYITSLVNNFESALYGDEFKDPSNGYRKYIDPQSFARWYLVMELMGNYDPNFYYVLPSRQDKILAGPVWDAEWSLGLTYKSSESGDWEQYPAQPDSEQAIWSEWKYYGRLFEDPYFVNIVKEEWSNLKPQLDSFRAKIASVAASISQEQVQNFEKWDILNKYVSVELVCTGSWEAEVEYIADFFNKRVEHINRTLQ